MALTTVNSSGIKDDSIVNADIKSDAAIAGSKISPDFGSQNIVTTGQIQVTAQIPAQFKRAVSGTSPVNVLIGNDTRTWSLEAHSTKFSINDYTAVNVERLVIDNTGNITIKDAKQLLFENDANNASSAILNLGASGASNLVFATGGAERLRLDANGNARLGPGGNNTNSTNYTTLTISNTAGGVLEFLDSGNNNIAGDIIGVEGSGMYISSKQDTPIIFRTGASNSEKVCIDSAGTVSIKNATYLSSSSTITSRLTLNSDNTSSWTGTRELVALDLIGNGADHRTGTLSIKCKKASGDSSPTEMVRVDGVHNLTKIISGNLDLGDGDLVIGTAGHGIDFSSTGSPLSGSSSNSELFADYERGSWTMGFEYYNTTTSAWTTVTFDNSPDYSSFDYVKCGHLVHVWGYTGGFDVGSDAVNKQARFTGLPYAAVWAAPYYGASCIFTHTSAFGDTSGNVEYVATGYTPYNEPVLYPMRPKTDSIAAWMNGSKTFMFSATYETAS